MKSQEATRLRVKNWEKFQHYHNRDPKWIKLYSDTLDDYEFNKLPDESKAHLILIWILAAKIGGYIPVDPAWVASKISATTDVNLTLLVDSGFLIPCNDDGNIVFASNLLARIANPASNLLARFQNPASLEIEIEREKENTEAASNLPVDSPSPPEKRDSSPARDACALPARDACAGETQNAYSTRDGNEWSLPPKLYAKYLTTYPNLDIDAELAKARVWCDANPRKRKTARGMPAFLTRWLNRADSALASDGAYAGANCDGPKTMSQIYGMLSPMDDDGGDA